MGVQSFFRRVLKQAVKHEFLVIVLVGVVLLRIPNLFEPYWYGDEGIYLILGQGLRHGLTLYRDIIDHKTPIIYYLASMPSQFWFKMLLVAWSVGIVSLFYAFARRLMLGKPAVYLATLALAVLTTLPWFEGNIANGELFVMGFVMAGAYLYSKTSIFSAYLKGTSTFHKDAKLLFWSGVCFSLGLLTKVPALFDLVAFGYVFFALFISNFSAKSFWHISKVKIPFALGILVPILLSILYFVMAGAGKEYLDFGLLYNFRYSQQFSLPFTNPLLVFLFSMPGKVAVVGVAGLFALAMRKKLHPSFQLVWAWAFLTLFAALLSSRPYPHYWLQAIPPLALLAGMFIEKKFTKEKLYATIPLVILVSTLLLFKVALYPTWSYYRNFMLFATQRISIEEYRQRFNPLMNDTYYTAEYIQKRTQPFERIFIWGTNPMLYALADRLPAGRFTVSFHIKDFGAYDETFNDIIAAEPEIIVVMNDEDGEFSRLYAHLATNYVLVERLPTMTIYKEMRSQ